MGEGGGETTNRGVFSRRRVRAGARMPKNSNTQVGGKQGKTEQTKVWTETGKGKQKDKVFAYSTKFNRKEKRVPTRKARKMKGRGGVGKPTPSS